MRQEDLLEWHAPRIEALTASTLARAGKSFYPKHEYVTSKGLAAGPS